MNFIEAPQEGDRMERKVNALPPFKVLNYKSGKTGLVNTKLYTPETPKQFFDDGDVGFSYYDKEKGVINVKEGTFALLGMYWKLSTYTGGQNKGGDRYTSNMVLDIRNDILRVYKNGEPTKHSGTYRQLKDQGVWSKETKIGMYWLLMEITTEQLYAVELTNTVKNGIKRSVLKAYSKPITAQTIQGEGLFGLFDSPDNFHTFTLLGANLANETGMPFKYDKSEGDAYFMPHFQCGILRKEKAPELATKLQEAREAFFTILKERNSKGDVPADIEPIKEAANESSLGVFIWPAAKAMSSGTSTAHAIAAAKRDPFAEDDPNDLPF